MATPAPRSASVLREPRPLPAPPLLPANDRFVIGGVLPERVIAVALPSGEEPEESVARLAACRRVGVGVAETIAELVVRVARENPTLTTHASATRCRTSATR